MADVQNNDKNETLFHSRLHFVELFMGTFDIAQNTSMDVYVRLATSVFVYCITLRNALQDITVNDEHLALGHFEGRLLPSYWIRCRA